MKLQTKILAGYLVLVAVICSMAAILVHERGRMREIEAETGEIQEIRRDITVAQRNIITLANIGRRRHRLGRGGLPALPHPAAADGQPAASHEAPLQGFRAPGTDRHAPRPLGGKRSPPAAPYGNFRPSGRGRQPAGEPSARSGETCHPCTHRDAEKERHRRGFWRQEDRADTPLRQGTAPVQRQPARRTS